MRRGRRGGRRRGRRGGRRKVKEEEPERAEGGMPWWRKKLVIL